MKTLTKILKWTFWLIVALVLALVVALEVALTNLSQKTPEQQEAEQEAEQEANAAIAQINLDQARAFTAVRGFGQRIANEKRRMRPG